MIADTKFVLENFSCFAETFTPSLDNRQVNADQMLTELPSEKNFEDCIVFSKTNK